MVRFFCQNFRRDLFAARAGRRLAGRRPAAGRRSVAVVATGTAGVVAARAVAAGVVVLRRRGRFGDLRHAGEILGAVGLDHEPLARDVLALPGAGLEVADVVVDGPALDGELLGAVRAGDRADDLGADTLELGLSVVGQRGQPNLGAVAVAGGL